MKRAEYLFTSNADGGMKSCQTIAYILPPTLTNYLTYDDKKNLRQVEFFQSTDPGRSFSRLKVMGVDDKPSVFRAVRGYQWLSFPQVYAWDFAFAFCPNNPSQIVVESFDKAGNSYKMIEQHDFAYTYDADGFPSKINLNISYYAAVTKRYSAVYDITYK